MSTPSVKVNMKGGHVNGVVGAGTVYKDAIISSGNTQIGDILSGPGSIKVGGNVQSLTASNAKAEEPRSDTSQISSNSRNNESTENIEGTQYEQRPTRNGSGNGQSRSHTPNEPTQIASDFENDVYTNLAGRPLRDIEETMAGLRTLAVYTWEDFELLEESDLTEAGIKVVNARRLLRHHRDSNE